MLQGVRGIDAPAHLSQHLCTYVHNIIVSFAVFIFYFNCISFAIRLSGRKVAIKLIGLDWIGFKDTFQCAALPIYGDIKSAFHSQ